jgi:hypothetical protein
MPFTQYGESVNRGRKSTYHRTLLKRTVNPGESTTNVLHVNRQFDMTHTRNYLIKCSREIQRGEEEMFETVESNTLKFYVREPSVD